MSICITNPTIGPILEKLSNWYWKKNPDNTPAISPATENPSEEKSGHIPMDRVSPEITGKIVRTLENKLIEYSSVEENYPSIGGVDSSVKILNLFDQYEKESIIKVLAKEDPELAEEIQKRGTIHEIL